MNRIYCYGLILTLLGGCAKQGESDLNDVLMKFNESTSQIRKLEYKAHRIDTFAQDGSVWNNTGYALIEKGDEDELFGFSFYGIRDDVPKEYIYQDGIFFEISNIDSTYRTESGHPGIIGKPGGQMIPQNLFQLDSLYSSVSLSENHSNYILRYTYENDTTYLVKDRVKVLELTKDSFFPWRITQTSTVMGNKTFSQTTLSDIRINGEVQSSINGFLSSIRNYTAYQPEQPTTNKIINNALPNISLPDLSDQSDTVQIRIEKLTLIDFWEVWCGHCIASLPKVEELAQAYKSDLEVIGIISDDYEGAIQLIENKGISFQNLIGNRRVEREFNVNRWPTYFLVDKSGIVLKEYFGFSDQIESDIKHIIESKDVV
jgi:thiol-disulfide isomerase/thioredoxin